MKEALQQAIAKLGSPISVIGAVISSAVFLTDAAETLGWRVMFIVVFVGCCAWLIHVMSSHEPDQFDPASVKWAYEVKVRWLAALMALLGSIPAGYSVYSLCVRRSPVVAESPIPVSIGSRPGISVTLSNKGESARAVVLFRVGMGQGGGKLMMVGTTTYVVSGSVDASGAVAGTSRTAGAAAGGVQYPVKGEIRITSEGWNLPFDIPVRVEVQAGRYWELNVALPDTLEVKPASDSGNPLAAQLESYITKDRFNLRRFLAASGDVAVTMELVDSEGLRNSSKANLKFPE